MYTVTKTFTVLNRRFLPGMTVSDEDLAGDVTPSTWIELGYIEVPVMAPRGKGAVNDVE